MGRRQRHDDASLHVAPAGQAPTTASASAAPPVATPLRRWPRGHGRTHHAPLGWSGQPQPSSCPGTGAHSPQVHPGSPCRLRLPSDRLGSYWHRRRPHSDVSSCRPRCRGPRPGSAACAERRRMARPLVTPSRGGAPCRGGAGAWRPPAAGLWRRRYHDSVVWHPVPRVADARVPRHPAAHQVLVSQRVDGWREGERIDGPTVSRGYHPCVPLRRQQRHPQAAVTAMAPLAVLGLRVLAAAGLLGSKAGAARPWSLTPRLAGFTSKPGDVQTLLSLSQAHGR